MYVLGIWDGHDAGACIVEKNRIEVAVNEERFTKRKLDVGFPFNSIIIFPPNDSLLILNFFFENI